VSVDPGRAANVWAIVTGKGDEMDVIACPIPHDPPEVGVRTEVPDLAQIEGARLLANQARPFLEICGFTDSQILHWAETYIAREGSGDVESFVAWIHGREPVC
jgi:hypothetical protein